MTIAEILAGESKNVEFKENLPEKNIKYMKSVVAFANGTGGKIIFGREGGVCVRAVGLREPEFIGGEVDFCFNIYRGQTDTNNANGIQDGVDDAENDVNGVKVGVNKKETQVEKLLQIIEKNPSATQAYYAEQIGVSKRTISGMCVSLQEKGMLVQNGTKRRANWFIIK